MKTNVNNNKYVFLASFLLPEGMLSYFDVVNVVEEPSPNEIVFTGGILHIYLDELDNRTEAEKSFRPNGFTEPTVVSDFPIRDRKVILHIRRRRWLDDQNKNVVINVYNLAVTGTRYSEEFAAFLKERLGYIPSDGPFAGAVFQD